MRPPLTKKGPLRQHAGHGFVLPDQPKKVETFLTAHLLKPGPR